MARSFTSRNMSPAPPAFTLMLNHYFGSCGLSQESSEDFAGKLGEKLLITHSTWGWGASMRGLRRLPSSTSFHDYFLALVIECDAFPGVNRGDGHAQRDGMGITGLDRGVGCFPASHALHPVADVRRGVRIACGVRRGGNSPCSFIQGNIW